MSGYPYGKPGSYGYGYSYGASYPYASAPPPPNSYSSPSAPYAASPVPNQYGAAPPSTANPYGAAPPSVNPYGAAPSSTANPYGAAPSSTANPYGAASPYGGKPPKDKPQGPYSSSYGEKPPNDKPHASAPPFGSAPGAYGNPFASLMPSSFPPGTDPNLIACFNLADQDSSGFIDDKELQMALSGYNQSFSLNTVHLLMYLFTNTTTRVIGPKEFIQVFYSLQNWRAIFDKFDRDGSGRIDSNELRDALLNLGFAVSPAVLDLLIVKFDRSGGRNRAIDYDNFIECCLIVKGLTEKFKQKDASFSGSATFSYDAFLLTVLPFLIA